jgi:hypothetical protein
MGARAQGMGRGPHVVPQSRPSAACLEGASMDTVGTCVWLGCLCVCLCLWLYVG